MAWPLSSLYKTRWASGRHIGVAKPTMYVEYRLVKLNMGYDEWTGPPINAFVGGGFGLPWQKWYTPLPGTDGEWKELPNVLEVDDSQQLANNGIAVATIQMENIAYPAVAGPGGDYHQVKRGYYAPLRGYVGPGRVPLTEGGQVIAKNEWTRKLRQNGQVKIWMGYGGERVPVFVGLVDDVDTESHPDRIILTVRDMGQTLTDQRVFGWNKEPRIQPPTIFVDRRKADNIREVGSNAKASSSSEGHPPSDVLDDSIQTYWRSQAHSASNVTEWVQIDLPQGRYEGFELYPAYPGMEMYVSIFARDRLPEQTSGQVGGDPVPPLTGGPPLFNRQEIPEGWHDRGFGDVPGANGGIPWVVHRTGLPDKSADRGLDGIYWIGPNSVLRVSFRALSRRYDGNYYAGVRNLRANLRFLTNEARRKHHILVDDVADMVKVAFRWAGFKEWDVETTGTRLKEKFTVPASNFFIDIIKAATEQTGFIFFMNDPTDDPESLGIPTFRRPLVVDPRIEPRASVPDTSLLTALKSKDSDEPRGYIIRVRGRTAKKSEGGLRLSGDSTLRVMYVYRPPWWRELGVVKHVVHTNRMFKTVDDCQAACYYIALQEELEAQKATCELPGFPGFELDSHAAILDVGTGMSQRLYVTERSLNFRRGEQVHFKMTLGGALVDTPHIQQIVQDIDNITAVL